jgi:hypothetical protein
MRRNCKDRTSGRPLRVAISLARSDGVSPDALPSSCGVVYPMGMPATVNDLTVDMLDALPEDGQRYEVIDGELFVTPGPGEPTRTSWANYTLGFAST